MSIIRRLALSIAPTTLALLPLACEDSGVAESGQAQTQLAAARTAYLEVVANRPSMFLPADAAASASDDEEARQIEAYLARERRPTEHSRASPIRSRRSRRTATPPRASCSRK